MQTKCNRAKFPSLPFHPTHTLGIVAAELDLEPVCSEWIDIKNSKRQNTNWLNQIFSIHQICEEKEIDNRSQLKHRQPTSILIEINQIKPNQTKSKKNKLNQIKSKFLKVNLINAKQRTIKSNPTKTDPIKAKSVQALLILIIQISLNYIE